MKASRKAKNAFLTSLISLVLCFSMLLGTTYAWFTDTASTAVNTIQAGKLDVGLEMKDNSGNWVNAEGKTLQFKVNGQIPAAGTKILWEPGCRYELPALRVVNKGNLALKYKIAITGIVGDVGLMKALDFTVTGVDTVSDTNDLNGFEGSLEANSETGMITITGHMDENAGNEYQNMKIENIGITVLATQLGGTFDGVTGEFDSIGNEYDKYATYPPLASHLNETTTAAKPESGDMVIESTNAKSTVPEAAAIKSAAKTTDSTATISNQPMATGSTLDRVLKTTEATADSVTYDISYVYTETSDGTSTSYDVSEFSSVVTNVIELSTGLKNVKVTHSHNGVATPMEEAGSETANEDGKYFYNPSTGKLTIWSSKYSSFEVKFESDFVAAVNGQGYATLKAAVNVAKDGDTVVLVKDIELPFMTFEKNLVIDLNGCNIIGTATGSFAFYITGNLKLMNSSEMESKVISHATYGPYVHGNNNGKTPHLTIENITMENASSSGYALIAQSKPANSATIEIISGTFKNGVYNYNSNVQIKGGRFAEDMSEFCAEGYITAKNADGWYVVVSRSEYLDQSAAPSYSERDDEAKKISIGSAGELVKLTKDVAEGNTFAEYTITLTDDIDLRGSNWCSIGADDTPRYFAGVFDGDSHTITMGTDEVLFGQLINATVQNLNVILDGQILTIATSNTTFDGVTVKGEATLGNNEGAFVRYPSNNITLRNCTNEATLTAGGAWNNYNAVFVGYGKLANGGTFTFENCVNKGSLVCGTASMFVGNISYGNPNLVINNCRNEGTIHAVYVGSDYIFNTISSTNNDGHDTFSQATVDGVLYKGAKMREIPFEYFGGTWMHGPADEHLALRLDENNKLVLTPSQNENIAYYEVKVGVYGAIVKGGSCQYHVVQKVNANEYANVTLKKLEFVDDTWVAEHGTAVMSKHNDGAGEYTMYTLDGTDYYLYYCGNNEYTLHGQPKMATEFSVSGYNAQGKLVASVGLSK